MHGRAIPHSFSSQLTDVQTEFLLTLSLLIISHLSIHHISAQVNKRRALPLKEDSRGSWKVKRENRLLRWNSDLTVMSSCQLDRLPVEMVHHILSYLSAYEIFVSLHHVTSYVDAVLSNYSYYVVNFESVPKLEFDFVCLRTVPNQILSITLSDGWETPGQVKLFLSRFHISQFTRLRSLTLIGVGAELWEATITKIINLKSLRSFAIIAQHNFKRWYTPMSGANLKALDSNLLDIYRVVLPQLNRLRLPHGDYLKRLHLPNLRYLILSQTSLEVLQHIAQAAPHLRSLKTKFRHRNCSEIIFLFPELKWLSLTIDGKRVSQFPSSSVPLNDDLLLTRCSALDKRHGTNHLKSSPSEVLTVSI